MKRFRVFELFLIAIVFSGSVLGENLDTIISAGLLEPFGVTIDPLNAFYVTDSGNNRIIKYVLDTGEQSSYAGGNGAGYLDGISSAAKFSNPQGVVAARGGIVVADSGNHLIRFITTAGVVSTLAGSSAGQADGTGPTARFNSPAALAADSAGNIYIADMLNTAIRKLSTNNQVTTLSTAFIKPTGVAVTPDGLAVFVADSGANSIYVITNGVVNLVAGSGLRYGSGYKDATSGADALFNAPRGIMWAGDAFGLLVSDSGNHLLRQIKYNSAANAYSVSTHAFTGPPLVLPIGLAQTLTGGFLVVDSGANSLRGFLPTQTAVGDPAIGYIEDPNTLTNTTFRTFIQITNSTFFNDTVIAIRTETGAQTYYTLDGTDPNSTNGATAPLLRLDGTTKSILDNSIQNTQSNILIKAISVASGRPPSSIVSAQVLFQVANPSIRGSEPANITIECETKSALLYYTIDGSDPSPAHGIQYFLGTKIDFGNLSTNVVLKVRGFRTGYASSGIVAGSVLFDKANASSTGVSREFTAGIGSLLLVPIEVHVRPEDTLKTIQYRVEITGSGVPITSLQPFGATTNDVINPLKTYTGFFDAPDLSLPYSLTNGAGLLLGNFRSNPGNNFTATNGTYLAALIAVPIPTNAQVGQTYSIAVISPSGTSDGLSLPVPLIAGTNHTITVTNIAYLVGDSARTVWYSAGEFGNGNLNNNDVLTAFQVAVGFLNAYEGTDLFDALDASPEDSAGGPGGDGLISLADWNVIFTRSLRLKPVNYARIRIPGGGRSVILTNLTDLPDTTADSLSTLNSSDAWVAHGSLGASIVENVSPGSDIQIPISLNMFSGLTASAAQFRADVLPVGGAPTIIEPIEFIAASGLPAPPMTTSLPGAIGCGWPLGSFRPELRDITLIGYLKFKVPSSALKGQSYIVRLSHVDASTARADGSFTPYKIESIPGAVWVQSPALQALDIIPDEWKVRFFGNAASPLAQPTADPDGDGKTNLQEYLAGTNPAKVRFHTLDQDWRNTLSNGFKLRWYASTGKTFIIEMSSDMTIWQPITTVSGTGNVQEITAPKTSSIAQYFRIRLNP